MAGALVAAGIFEACYLRPYYRALEGDDASRVLTLFSFIPVFSLVLAYCLLGESVSAAGLAGGAIIVLGNIFVSWDPKRRGGVRLRTVALIAFASLLLAGNYVLYRFAVDGTRLGFTELLTWVSLGGALGSALNIVLSPEGRRELLDSGTYRGRRLYGLMFTNHALDQLGLLCAYAAYLFAPVFVVASIISALPLFALFLASFSTRFFSLLSGAKLSRYEVVQRIVAVSVTMAGLYLVQL